MKNKIRQREHANNKTALVLSGRIPAINTHKIVQGMLL